MAKAEADQSLGIVQEIGFIGKRIFPCYPSPRQPWPAKYALLAYAALSA